MRLIVGLIAVLSIANVAAACDRDAAHKVQDALRGLAQIKEQGDRVSYTWGPAWDNWTDERRLRMTRAAADADACLTSTARDIRFYANGRLVGVASPSGGIRLTLEK